MSVPLIEVRSVSKKFSAGLRAALWHGVQDVAHELTWWRDTHTSDLRKGEFWALRDISFELHPGESLGVIGGNGAGKSTLLKVMSGLFAPDAGSVKSRGSVRAIVELGAAFNPALSGRENIFLQAALYGYPRRDVRPQLDPVVEFADLEGFIDAPVQQYSDGMRARLGFAVAVHLAPDLLLVDEVLAVGDLAFQNKCLNRMRQYLAEGGALVFVSHAMHQVQAACERGLVLEHGEARFSGNVVPAVDFYLKRQKLPGDAVALDNAMIHGGPGPRQTAGTSIEAVAVCPRGRSELHTGGAVRLVVRFVSDRSRNSVKLGFMIFTTGDGRCVAAGMPRESRGIEAGSGVLSCDVPRLPLEAGDYLMRVHLFDEELGYPLAYSGWEDAPHHFSVRSEPDGIANLTRFGGARVRLDTEWSANEPETAQTGVTSHTDAG